MPDLHTLPIACDNCGACCMHMRTPPHLVFTNEQGVSASMGGEFSEEDLAWLNAAPQEARDIRLAQLLSDVPEDYPCSWFNISTRRCQYHEFRPGICRDFEVGSEECIGHRELRGIK